MPRKVAPRKAKSAARKNNKQKPAPKPKRRSQPSQAQKSDAIDALMAAGAQALALPLEEAFKAGVKSNLQALFVHAAFVEAFSLPDDAEPAPVFHA